MVFPVGAITTQPEASRRRSLSAGYSISGKIQTDRKAADFEI